MNILDYGAFFRSELPTDQVWNATKWDVFISAFNSSERVKLVFDKVAATNKFWLIHNEYGYKSGELPSGMCLTSPENEEAAFVISIFDQIKNKIAKEIKDVSICVDITGFMRPHLLFLVVFLKNIGIEQFDIIYSEPQRYAKKEQTTFSVGSILVRQVAGFEGVNSPNQSDDFLIIGSGYDHRLIKAVAEQKDKADKVQIFGLPSLRADMYQENVLNAHKASDAVGINRDFSLDRFFAPANDPFVTASVISDIVQRRKKNRQISNLYLSPLSTKPQALGFALYYIAECLNQPASILFPISTQYARETSTGLARVWQYTVEFPLL